MAQKACVNVQGSHREVNKIYVRVGGVQREVVKAYVNVGGSQRVWWPNTGGGVPPLAPGNYEPQLVSGGGATGGRFDLSPYTGSNITAVAAKIAWFALPDGTPTAIGANGQPTGTFYRNITPQLEWSNRTIYHDLQATAAAEFNANNADGYTLSGGNTFFVASTRLRITIS